ncbi:zinc finger MYM-type protein 1-like [Actinia tenebrosa]|uniref:Zinc finger MYM-type protein 1-like n=1 Tax=Actinia tenebrosa TaxID=6105 RepID=A0A6P8IT06_ACTTE|nr:zinc finger MYM-type protein 1-like [Actinia tenebrosa]
MAKQRSIGEFFKADLSKENNSVEVVLDQHEAANSSNEQITSVEELSPKIGPKESELATGLPKRKIASKIRCFREEWYNNNEWLEYSTALHGMICFACRLFGGLSKDDNWVRSGVNNWKKATEKIGEQSQSAFHQTNLIKWKSYSNLKKPIDCILDEQKEKERSARAAQIERNQQIIIRISDVCKFLAKQNIAFRGHDESKDSCNKGNFRELIELLAKYDPLLNEHLLKAPKNSTYLSPEIQNSVIETLGELILSSIVDEVREARFFAIMVDETTDISHHEQMCICIRYVNTQTTEVQERFVGFLQVANITAATLYDTIVQYLQKFNVDLEKIRGYYLMLSRKIIFQIEIDKELLAFNDGTEKAIFTSNDFIGERSV